MKGSTLWLWKRRRRRRSEDEAFNQWDTSQVSHLFIIFTRPKPVFHQKCLLCPAPNYRYHPDFCFCVSVCTLAKYVLHVNLAPGLFVLPLSQQGAAVTWVYSQRNWAFPNGVTPCQNTPSPTSKWSQFFLGNLNKIKYLPSHLAWQPHFATTLQ